MIHFYKRCSRSIIMFFFKVEASLSNILKFCVVRPFQCFSFISAVNIYIHFGFAICLLSRFAQKCPHIIFEWLVRIKMNPCKCWAKILRTAAYWKHGGSIAIRKFCRWFKIWIVFSLDIPKVNLCRWTWKRNWNSFKLCSAWLQVCNRRVRWIHNFLKFFCDCWYKEVFL